MKHFMDRQGDLEVVFDFSYCFKADSRDLERNLEISLPHEPPNDLAAKNSLPGNKVKCPHVLPRP